MPLNAQFALFSRSKYISLGVVQSIAKSVTAQLQEDVKPLWGRTGTVTPFAHESQVPKGYWKVIIEDDIGQPGALGFHTDELNQPIAYVSAQDGHVDNVSVTVSHEVIETLLDPNGNRLVQNILHPLDDSERVQMLLEGCDPSEAKSYTKQGNLVSDFYLPEWLDDSVTQGQKYTFLGAITHPRRIIAGGYCSFVGQDGKWYQVTAFGTQPVLEGPFDWELKDGESLREMVDRNTRPRM
jgi:hypothetical protein